MAKQITNQQKKAIINMIDNGEVSQLKQEDCLTEEEGSYEAWKCLMLQNDYEIPEKLHNALVCHLAHEITARKFA